MGRSPAPRIPPSAISAYNLRTGPTTARAAGQRCERDARGALCDLKRKTTGSAARNSTWLRSGCKTRALAPGASNDCCSCRAGSTTASSPNRSAFIRTSPRRYRLLMVARHASLRACTHLLTSPDQRPSRYRPVARPGCSQRAVLARDKPSGRCPHPAHREKLPSFHARGAFHSGRARRETSILRPRIFRHP